jgi:hypothetical protein
MNVLPVELVINGLTIAAGSSLLVERFTEFLRHVKDKANRQFLECETEEAQKKQLEQAHKLLDAIKEKHQEGGVEAVTTMLASADTDKSEVESDVDTPDNYERYSSVLYLPITPVSDMVAAFNLFIRVAPMALGIILAWWFNLHLVALFTGYEVKSAELLIKQGALATIFWQHMDTLLTGILVGGGSQPIHVLLRFLSTRKLTDEEREALDQVIDPAEEADVKEENSVPAIQSGVVEPDKDQNLAWHDIKYLGGVNPQSLQNKHVRKKNPSLIVVHHTAMNSKLDFAAIVDEFLNKKKWLTGYHCVIMPDGKIRPFCRWDRMGNHTKGNNAYTLGVSFHGNFYNHPGDAYSNHDGRYGNSRPTEAQLQSGARLIALWRHLYGDIPADITEAVKPHRAMPGANTVCPGNQFPFAQLLTNVLTFEQAWSTSEVAQQQLLLFRQKPYIYVNASA